MSVFAGLEGLIIVHGDARGADRLCRDWALANGAQHEPHPAPWNQHGKAAGPIRNREMAELGARLCVAFPGGSGTKDMTVAARNLGIPVLQVLTPIAVPARCSWCGRADSHHHGLASFDSDKDLGRG